MPSLCLIPTLAWADPPRVAVGVQPWTDTACFTIEHSCPNPESLSVDLAGHSIVEWDRPGLGQDGTPLPTSICVDVDAFVGDGLKVLYVSETCGVVLESSSTQVEIDDLGFELLRVGVVEPEVRPGMIVTVIVEATMPGLSIALDYSAIDPNYYPGSEIVVDNNDGTYEVAYQLSAGGSMPMGVRALPLTISDAAATSTRTWTDVVRVPYSVARTPVFQVTGDRVGRILYLELPSATPLIYEAKVVVNSLALSDSTLSRGEVTTLTGQFDVYGESLTHGIATLYIAEDTADGVIEVTVAGTNESCTTGTGGEVCRYDFTVDLQLRPDVEALTGGTGQFPTFSSQLSVGVRASVWDAFTDAPPSLDYIPFTDGPILDDAPPSTSPVYVARGHITYVDHTIEAQQNPLQPHSQTPQFDNVSRTTNDRNLANTRVQVRDGCNGVYEGLTDDLGNYQLLFTTTCPHLVASIWVVSESERGYIRTQVMDTGDVLYDKNIAGFVPQNAWINELGATNLANLESSPFRILQVLMMGQTWTKENMLGEDWVYAMPWAKARWERDWCPDVDLATSQFNSGDGIIEICSADGIGESGVNRDEWDPFVILHEYFHWVQHEFMRGGVGAAYSDRRRDALEGFAVVLPALVRGNEWRTERHKGGDANNIYGANSFTAENLDFNGNTSGTKRWLPIDLWGMEPQCTEDTVDDCSVHASSAGGWAWRILWDIADPDEFTMVEPYVAYVRGPQGVILLSLVAHDEFGDLSLWLDLLTGYLGGGYIETNPMLSNLDRGLPGMEIVEYIDGVVCRENGVVLADINVVTHDVMDFRQYEPIGAPISCP